MTLMAWVAHRSQQKTSLWMQNAVLQPFRFLTRVLRLVVKYSDTSANEDNSYRYHIRQPKRAPGMARPFMFAALCQRAHPLKHSLAESILVSRVTRQPRYHCTADCAATKVIAVLFSQGVWDSRCLLRIVRLSCLTFWRRNYFFSFQHTLYIKCE